MILKSHMKDKLKNFIIKNNITELITFEIEDKFFENKIKKIN